MLLRIVLKKYIPLLSSGISEVDLNTNHHINMFISLNGAGKSSVLKEANPINPDKSNYKEGGSKYTEWKFNGNHIKLLSEPYKSDGHSFILNGKELNTNGTGQVQSNLVLTHFRLDNSLNKVLNGLRVSDLFTVMRPAQRKDVLMQIYPNDTEYALGVYNKLKAERNNLKGAIRNQVLRYTEENSKLQSINECSTEDLENRIKEIEIELRQSLLVRGGLANITVDPDLTAKINDFEYSVDRLAVNRLSGVLFTQQETASAIETVTNFLRMHQEQANVIKRVIAEHASSLEGLEEFLANPEVFKTQSNIINGDLKTVNDSINDYMSVLSRYSVFNNPDVNLDHLVDVTKEFGGYLNRVVTASDSNLTGGVYKGYITLSEKLTVELHQLERTLDEVTHKLNHYDKADPIECPDCKHEFKLGITAKELDDLRITKDHLTRRVTTTRNEIERLSTLIENDAEWYNSMNQLFGFIRANGHVTCLALLIKEYSVGKIHNTSLLNALEAHTELNKLLTHKEGLLKEQNLLEARLELLDRNNILDVAIYVASTEKELVEENNLITHYTNKLESLKRTMKDIVSHKRDVTRLREMRVTILQELNNKGLVDLRTRIDERIALLGSAKDEHMTSIIKGRSLSAVVTSISDDITRLKRRLKLVEIAMDALCPNKGIIGELMSDFLKAVTANMNAIFKEVWNTPLYLLPCNKSNGDLTYKFPVIVGEGEPNPDIADTSAGEQEIINWAFREVISKYHPIPYPSFMDEVGVNLDEIKRTRFFNYVEELTRSGTPRQMFIVSHYIAANGVFKNPNIIALRYEGLTLPGVVNEHSTII